MRWYGSSRSVRRWLVGLAGLAAACGGAPAVDLPPAAGGVFAAPQAIAASERFVLVANTAFGYRAGAPAWGDGSVTFIERATRRVVGHVRTTQPNPQAIAVHGETAYVVNGGTMRRGAGDVFEVTSPGGVDVIALERGVPAAVTANIPLPPSATDPRIGAFGSIALDPEGAYAFIGSGTRGDLFVIDLEAREVLRGAGDPIALFDTPPGENGMTVVRPAPGGLAVLSFNTDELCLVEIAGGALARQRCHPVGRNAELLEGPVDVAFDAAGRALVLMTIANSVYLVEPGADPPAVAPLAGTGLAGNRLRVHGDAAYVVNSLSNNLQRLELPGGASTLPFAVLPVGSNPYDLVATEEPEGPRAWVTLQAADAVALVDLQSGAVLDVLDGAEQAPPLADAAPPAPDCGAAMDDLFGGIVGIGGVVRARYGEGAGLGQDALPAVIQGGPHGRGVGGGATDSVLSLGVGGELVVDFGAHEIVDGPGPDFIVFENAFLINGVPCQPHAEPALVAVSVADSAEESFVEFPCDLTVTEGDAQRERWPFPGCAGVHPVLANVGASCTDPRDPVHAGGDAFDLASVGLARARFLRLRDAGRGKLGEQSKGFDLDAIVLIHHAPR